MTIENHNGFEFEIWGKDIDTLAEKYAYIIYLTAGIYEDGNYIESNFYATEKEARTCAIKYIQLKLQHAEQQS